MIRDVLLQGISDLDIRREVLGRSDSLDTMVNNDIALVESKEMARNALPSANLSSVSSFKQQQSCPPIPSNKQATCPDCKVIPDVYITVSAIEQKTIKGLFKQL